MKFQRQHLSCCRWFRIPSLNSLNTFPFYISRYVSLVTLTWQCINCSSDLVIFSSYFLVIYFRLLGSAIYLWLAYYTKRYLPRWKDIDFYNKYSLSKSILLQRATIVSNILLLPLTSASQMAYRYKNCIPHYSKPFSQNTLESFRLFINWLWKHLNSVYQSLRKPKTFMDHFK